MHPFRKGKGEGKQNQRKKDDLKCRDLNLEMKGTSVVHIIFLNAEILEI